MNSSVHEALDRWVDAHFDDEVRFLQALVRVPTDMPPGDNAPHAEATAALLEGFGFAVERHPVPDDVLAAADAICTRRGLSYLIEETMRVAASPSAPEWQARWERAVESLGLPVHRMPSGAGHDAMKIGEVMPQAMLFVRGENAGISHNPLESSNADDMQLAIEAFLLLLDGLAAETAPR